MRHRCATSNLGRKPAHRLATVRNLAINLFRHGRIRTTIQKAKAARRLVERIVSLGKKGTLHSRRLAIAELGGTLAAKQTVKRVFAEIAGGYANRPGGCTRIVRLPVMTRLSEKEAAMVGQKRRSKFYGTRQGDNADMVLFELVETGQVGGGEGRKRRKMLRRTTKKMREAAGKTDGGSPAKVKDEAGGAELSSAPQAGTAGGASASDSSASAPKQAETQGQAGDAQAAQAANEAAASGSKPDSSTAQPPPAV